MSQVILILDVDLQYSRRLAQRLAPSHEALDWRCYALSEAHQLERWQNHKPYPILLYNPEMELGLENLEAFVCIALCDQKLSYRAEQTLSKHKRVTLLQVNRWAGLTFLRQQILFCCQLQRQKENQKANALMSYLLLTDPQSERWLEEWQRIKEAYPNTETLMLPIMSNTCWQTLTKGVLSARASVPSFSETPPFSQRNLNQLLQRYPQLSDSELLQFFKLSRLGLYCPPCSDAEWQLLRKEQKQTSTSLENLLKRLEERAQQDQAALVLLLLAPLSEATWLKKLLPICEELIVIESALATNAAHIRLLADLKKSHAYRYLIGSQPAVDALYGGKHEAA